MKNNDYSFVSCWQIAAPVKELWESIYESAYWPKWWKGVERVKIIKENDINGINGIREYTWKSALPYRLSFQMKLVEKIEYKLLRELLLANLKETAPGSLQKRTE